MPDKSDGWGWVPWLQKWERRGELAVTLGVTAGATWLAAAVPSEHVTHVDIWPPVIVFGVIAAVGIYVVVAAEKKWWLPGKQSAFDEATGRAQYEVITKLRDSGRLSHEAAALSRIATTLEEIRSQLIEPDEPTQQ